MENKQKRKARAANGDAQQKMMSFRADGMTVRILDFVSNKGRLINRLVQEWADKHHILDDPDAPPEENSIEEYMK